MDDFPQPAPKRSRTTNGYAESPDGYRSQSPEQAEGNTSPTYQLAERPASARRPEDFEAYGNETPVELTTTFYHEDSRPSRTPSPPLPVKAVKPTRLQYKPRMTLHGHTKAISAVKFSPHGKHIASACKLQYAAFSCGSRRSWLTEALP
jgi:COMPASS component SWD3